MILTILGGEDLLSMLNGTRSKPIATSTNPTGYTERRIIVEANGEDAILNADDVFYYLHDSRSDFRKLPVYVPNRYIDEEWNITLGSLHPAPFWNNLR